MTEADQNYTEQTLDPEEIKTLEWIRGSHLLTVVCRRFVYPQYNEIGVMDENANFRSLRAPRLFELLGIPASRLREVYEYSDLSGSDKAGEGRFTGYFTESGKQQLANILGKIVQFYYQPSSDPMFDPESREIYVPRS